MSKESDATKLVKLYAGHVIIRDGRKEYNDTLENFVLDAEEDFPALPNNMIGRSYIPDFWHRVMDGRKVIPLPKPWPEGENLLGRIDELLAAQSARVSVPDLDPEEPVEIRVKRLDALEAALARLAQQAEATPEEKDYQDSKGRIQVVPAPKGQL